MTPPVPRPTDGFLDTQVRLRRRGAARWSNRSGERLYEWDSLHGHVEGYDKRGWHIGVFDGTTGRMIGPAVKGRRIDV